MDPDGSDQEERENVEARASPSTLEGTNEEDMIFDHHENIAPELVPTLLSEDNPSPVGENELDASTELNSEANKRDIEQVSLPTRERQQVCTPTDWCSALWACTKAMGILKFGMLSYRHDGREKYEPRFMSVSTEGISLWKIESLSPLVCPCCLQSVQQDLLHPLLPPLMTFIHQVPYVPNMVKVKEAHDGKSFILETGGADGEIILKGFNSTSQERWINFFNHVGKVDTTPPRFGWILAESKKSKVWQRMWAYADVSKNTLRFYAVLRPKVFVPRVSLLSFDDISKPRSRSSSVSQHFQVQGEPVEMVVRTGLNVKIKSKQGRRTNRWVFKLRVKAEPVHPTPDSVINKVLLERCSEEKVSLATNAVSYLKDLAKRASLLFASQVIRKAKFKASLRPTDNEHVANSDTVVVSLDVLDRAHAAVIEEEIKEWGDKIQRLIHGQLIGKLQAERFLMDMIPIPEHKNNIVQHTHNCLELRKSQQKWLNSPDRSWNRSITEGMWFRVYTGTGTLDRCWVQCLENGNASSQLCIIPSSMVPNDFADARISRERLCQIFNDDLQKQATTVPKGLAPRRHAIHWLRDVTILEWYTSGQSTSSFRVCTRQENKQKVTEDIEYYFSATNDDGKPESQGSGEVTSHEDLRTESERLQTLNYDDDDSEEEDVEAANLSHFQDENDDKKTKRTLLRGSNFSAPRGFREHKFMLKLRFPIGSLDSTRTVVYYLAADTLVQLTNVAESLQRYKLDSIPIKHAHGSNLTTVAPGQFLKGISGYTERGDMIIDKGMGTSRTTSIPMGWLYKTGPNINSKVRRRLFRVAENEHLGNGLLYGKSLDDVMEWAEHIKHAGQKGGKKLGKIPFVPAMRSSVPVALNLKKSQTQERYFLQIMVLPGDATNQNKIHEFGATILVHGMASSPWVANGSENEREFKEKRTWCFKTLSYDYAVAWAKKIQELSDQDFLLNLEAETRPQIHTVVDTLDISEDERIQPTPGRCCRGLEFLMSSSFSLSPEQGMKFSRELAEATNQACASCLGEKGQENIDLTLRIAEARLLLEGEFPLSCMDIITFTHPEPFLRKPFLDAAIISLISCLKDIAGLKTQEHMYSQAGTNSPGYIARGIMGSKLISHGLLKLKLQAKMYENILSLSRELFKTVYKGASKLYDEDYVTTLSSFGENTDKKQKPTTITQDVQGNMPTPPSNLLNTNDNVLLCAHWVHYLSLAIQKPFHLRTEEIANQCDGLVSFEAGTVKRVSRMMNATKTYNLKDPCKRIMSLTDTVRNLTVWETPDQLVSAYQKMVEQFGEPVSLNNMHNSDEQEKDRVVCVFQYKPGNSWGQLFGVLSEEEKDFVNTKLMQQYGSDVHDSFLHAIDGLQSKDASCLVEIQFMTSGFYELQQQSSIYRHIIRCTSWLDLQTEFACGD
eukprot:m.174025 g.174025  ORF g.174025 m.174025 type:complete len:1409 (-) comp15399_c0_seq3:93-4319(-)